MWKKIKKAIKKAGNVVVAVVVQAVNVVKEVVNRGFGIPDFLFSLFAGVRVLDFIATLFGLKLAKKLRLRVVILRDKAGAPLATPAEVAPSIDFAREVFKQARTEIVGAGGDLIRTVGGAAPSAALDVECGTMEVWTQDLGDAGAYFRRESAYNVTGVVLGYAAPVTVFVVHDVAGEGGCALGFAADYVTVDVGGLKEAPPGVLAHEVGHACGLWHMKAKTNLMHPDADGTVLRRWQEAIFRNSRHVTFL
jgi:hypothetical protein